MNVASDPLMTLSYLGIKGAMVILVADDPGPISSQTEQDTRHFAQFAKLPVFDPSSAQEAYDMIESDYKTAIQEIADGFGFRMSSPVQPIERLPKEYEGIHSLPADRQCPAGA